MKLTLTDQKGFSLLEVVTIVTVVGIISLFAVAKFGDTNSRLQYETIMEKIVSDVRFAQQLALTKGKATRVHIDQTNNRYFLKWDDDTYIKNPVGGNNFVIQLGSGDFSAVQITSTSFQNGRLDFERTGSPLNSGSVFSDKLDLVIINNAKKIVVTANTGFLEIENL
ncbi:hypothetical protein MJD09_12870 [bacterium]|nr:hypothetical protein [bacterium]